MCIKGLVGWQSCDQVPVPLSFALASVAARQYLGLVWSLLGRHAGQCISGIQHDPGSTPMISILPTMIRRNPAILCLLGLQILCGYLSLRFEPILVALPLLVTVITVSFFWSHLGLLILILSWFFPVALSESMGIYPADILLFAIVGGYLVRSLTEGQPPVRRTPLNLWIFLWMGALALSVLQAVDLSMAVKSWFRHAQLFLLYFALVGFTRIADIRRTLTLFVGLCLVFSLWNITTFVRAAGTVRAFGPAHVLFSGFLALVGTFATAGFLFANRSRPRFLWGVALCIIAAGQMANQSRGAMIQMVTGMIFVTWNAHRWSRQHLRPAMRRRIVVLTGFAVMGLLIAFLLTSPLVSKVLTRYATQEGNPLATAQMRVFLWGSALQMFGEHPFFGVGLSQEHVFGEILPGMRFSSWYLHTKGLGFHNSVLGYLAETGIVGSVFLLLLLWAALRLGRGIISETLDETQAMWRVGIWSVVFVIATRYLYEGHLFYSISGMTAVTFFAFLFVIRDHLSRTSPVG